MRVLNNNNVVQAVKTNGFDSKLEFNTYLNLKALNPKLLMTQYPILIKPQTQNYPNIFWHVDFKIVLQDDREFFVEAKGIANETFMLKMKFLEYLYPEVYQKIVIVVSRHKKQAQSYLSGVRVFLLNEIDQLLNEE